jgi:uncharacterized coiled-coil DUF342 family protein
LESDEADLVRDIGFDIDKANRKLKKVRERLKSVQEQTAAQVQQLTAAEARLSAAIDTAQSAPADDKSDAYRDLLEAFGKLDLSGRRAVVYYLQAEV